MAEPADVVLGPVMAQLAACRHAVGIALLNDPVAWELRGTPANLARCAAVTAPWDWRLAVSPHRAVALGAARLAFAMARLRATEPDVVISDRGGAWSVLVFTGPAAVDVCSKVARSSVRAAREADEWVALVDQTVARIAFHAALAAGRGAGAVAIDARALAIHRAARRIAAGQPPVFVPATGPPPRGVLTR